MSGFPTYIHVYFCRVPCLYIPGVKVYVCNKTMAVWGCYRPYKGIVNFKRIIRSDPVRIKRLKADAGVI